MSAQDLDQGERLLIGARLIMNAIFVSIFAFLWFGLVLKLCTPNVAEFLDAMQKQGESLENHRADTLKGTDQHI